MKRSLSGMFVISFVLVMILLLSVILGCYSMVLHQAREQAQISAAEMLSDTASSLRNEMLSMMDGSNIIADHRDVYSFMSGTTLERLRLRDSVRSLLTTYISFEPGAVNAYLFTADGAHLSAAPQRMEQDGSAAFMVSRRVWQDEHLGEPFRQAHFSRSYLYHGRMYYALCTPVYPDIAAPASSDYVGSMILVLQAQALSKAIPDSALNDTLIADGELLLTAPDDALQSIWTSDQRGTLMQQDVPMTGWTVYTAVPKVDSDHVVQRVGMLSVIIGSSALLLLGVLMVVQYRSIVGPIVDLAKQMAALDSEAGSIINPRRGIHQLNRLTGSMNSLLGRIHQLNEEMIHVRLKSYEEHITFLQAQINPHFLYNNFESIRGMASTGNAAAIREMASCMAAIYRYCCKGESLVVLQQELECLQRYLRILHLRFGDQYEVSVCAQQEALVYAVPRMILQPLVENAVTHGFVNAGRKQGRVEITATVENDELLLRIADDGTGMSEKQLEQYNKPAPEHDDGTHSHIGITNVMRRLQLIYGEHACVRFSAQEQGGLCIAIRIGQAPEKWTN